MSATGHFTTGRIYTGGFAGSIDTGTYTNIAVTGNVTIADHNSYIGVFAGYNNGTVRNASYTGTMTTPYSALSLGGFIGRTDARSVLQGVYSTASINAGDYFYDGNGGLVGVNYGTIDSSYATGNLTFGQSWYNGGLVGNNFGNISNSYATGNLSIIPGPVPGGNGLATYIQNYGGLVGFNQGGSITNSYATGNVTATGNSTYPAYRVGGLVGFLAGGSISRSYSTGSVNTTAQGHSYGGLVGQAAVSMTNVYASGNVTANPASDGSAPGNIGVNHQI